MSRYSLLLLLLLPWSAQAVICKSVDAKGGVAYSDVPAAECKHPVRLPEVSRYAPPPVGAEPPADNGTTNVAAPFAGYTEMRIEQPAAGGTVRSNEGKVPVATLGSTLTGVSPGTHSLGARIVDAAGRVLYSTGSIPFTLHREAKETTIPTTPPEGAYQPRYVPPSNGKTDFQPTNPVQPFKPSPEKPDYSSQSQPDYAPSTTPIPPSSGTTHPAFAPNYRP